MVKDCVMTGNKQGAFTVYQGGKLEASGNTYDPGDPTVPR